MYLFFIGKQKNVLNSAKKIKRGAPYVRKGYKRGPTKVEKKWDQDKNNQNSLSMDQFINKIQQRTTFPL